MTSLKGVLLSLPVATSALAALALGLIELGRYWGFGLSSLYLLVIPVALAIVYILWYRTLPYVPHPAPERSRPASLTAPAGEEPFEDPVEEADRIDQGRTEGTSTEEPTAAEHDSGADSRSSP